MLAIFTREYVETSKEQSAVTSSGHQVMTGNLLPVGLGMSKIQALSLGIFDRVQTVQSNRLVLGTAGIGVAHSLPLSLDSVTAVRTVHAIRLPLDPVLAPMVPALSWDILLDGVSLKSVALKMEIEFNQGQVFDTISVNLFGKKAFSRSNPLVGKGTLRLVVTINARVFNFLVEEREGDEQSFSIWGRSYAAVEDEPYKEKEDFTITTPTLASVLAQSFLNTQTVTWTAFDFVVPITFNQSGTPVEALMTLAAVVGAVVRSTPDGNFVVRRLWPIRPVFIPTTPSVLVLNRSSVLVGMGYRDEMGEGWNSVEVKGRGSGDSPPQMEVEESNPSQGSQVHVRVYWGGKRPKKLSKVLPAVSSYVTAGLAVLLGDDIEEEIENEEIVFEDGIARTQKPIYSLTNISWIGDRGNNIQFTVDSSELTIDSEAWRLADLTYKTRYSRYRITDHNVDRLLQVLTYYSQAELSVRVVILPGDKEAEAIQDELIINTDMAVERGTSYLDTVKYDRRTFSVETSYDDRLTDGIVVALDDGEVGCAGNFHIMGGAISIEGPKSTNRLECVQCQV